MRQILRKMDERLRSVTRWQVEVFWLRHVDDLSIERSRAGWIARTTPSARACIG